jgi:hypothetical protein
MNPVGLVNTVFTVTGTSTTGLSSTAQVRVTSDPRGSIGLGMLLDNTTEIGVGTAKMISKYFAKFRQLLKHLQVLSNSYT